MLVVLMRHGRAEGKRPGLRDEERRLTEEGRRGVEAVARLLPLPQPPLVLHSPLRRAVETADIVARVTGGEARLEPRLHPDDFGPDALQDILEEHWGGETPLVLVGHNPSMEEAVASLVGGSIALEPGAAAVVRAEAPGPGGGELVALITPTAALRCSGP